MTRFTEGDWPEDPAEIMAMGRFVHNARTVVTSRRGQTALRELEAMLLAMPKKRLISGWLATPDGEVCAVGLYCAAKRAEKERKDLRAAAAEMAHRTYGPASKWDEFEHVGPGQYQMSYEDWRGRTVTEIVEDDEGDVPTLDAGEDAGLTRTLAYLLGDLNDESCRHCTPEERWERVLAWVRSKIKVDAS